MLASDDDGARRLLVVEERGDRCLSFDKDGLREGYRLGAASESGDDARVPVIARADGRERTIPMVLHRESGQWRISLHDTMSELLGGDVRELQRGLQQGLEQVGRDMQQRVQQGMAEAVRGMQSELQEAARATR